MKIQDAIQAAHEQNECCIRRALGVMTVRYLRIDHPERGFFVTEIHGPLSEPDPVRSHYELSPGDLMAANWEVASGVDIPATDQTVAEEQDPRSISLPERIDAAAGRLCDIIAEWELDSPIDLLKAASDALTNIGMLRVSIIPSPAVKYPEMTEGERHHDDQQKTGE